MTETPEQSPSWPSLLFGMAVGLSLGVVVSLLYAPKTGQETRQDILDQMNTLKERMDELSHRMAETAKERLEEARADLAQAVEAGRTAAAERAAQLRQDVGLE